MRTKVREYHMYSKYERIVRVPSILVPGEMIDDPEGKTYYICPVCGNHNPPLEHFGTQVCKCGTQASLLGNKLELVGYVESSAGRTTERL